MRHSKPGCQISLLIITLSVLLAGSLAGCTFKNIKPELSTVPAEKYSSVVVGSIVSDDKLWEYLVPHFRQGLVDGLNQQKTFATVYDSSPSTPLESSTLVSGKITEVRKGNAALRWIVGFGAGKAKVAGTFEISDVKGLTLARFRADESYAGGAGIGGAGLLDMEDLMRRFGKTIAEKISQWSRGEKLEE